MRLARAIIVAGFSLGALQVSAQWRENGKPVEEAPFRKSWGSHGAMLLLTDRPEELFAAWERSATAVPLIATETAQRGVPIVGVVIFSGCAPDPMNLCNADVEFQVFKPDGSPYGSEENAEVWVKKQPPALGQLQLSVGAIGVRIEKDDPSGKYRVRARVRDNVSGAKVELVQTFEVQP